MLKFDIIFNYIEQSYKIIFLLCKKTFYYIIKILTILSKAIKLY